MSRRQLAAHAIAARAQAECPEDPAAWISAFERDAEQEIARLRETLRRCRKARKWLAKLQPTGETP